MKSLAAFPQSVTSLRIVSFLSLNVFWEEIELLNVRSRQSLAFGISPCKRRRAVLNIILTHGQGVQQIWKLVGLEEKKALPVVFIPLSLLPVHRFPARAFSRIFLCSVKSSPLVTFDVVILSLFLMEFSYKRNHFYKCPNQYLSPVFGERKRHLVLHWWA